MEYDTLSVGLLLAAIGTLVAYIKVLHNGTIKQMELSFANERKGYEDRITDLRADKEAAEQRLEAMRQELLNFINSVDYGK